MTTVQTMLDQLQSAKNQGLIREFQVKSCEKFKSFDPKRHKQVVYILLCADRPREQMYQLADYFESHRDCIDHTRPLGADVLRVYVKW